MFDPIVMIRYIPKVYYFLTKRTGGYISFVNILIFITLMPFINLRFYYFFYYKY